MSRPSATSPGACERTAACPKEPAHPGQGRYPARPRTSFPRCGWRRHALGLEEDILPLEANRELDRDRGELRFVACVDSIPRAGERHEPVQGTAVEVVKAERPGDRCATVPFPEADGPSIA